jgi:hypothetical protein
VGDLVYDNAYEVNLPACWSLHEGAVHALSALWEAWRAVYLRSDKLPAMTAPAGWHVQFQRPITTALLAEGSPLALCRKQEAHSPYRRPRTFLPDALDRIAADPARSGALQDPAEAPLFAEATPTQGSAAVVAVLHAT